MTIVAPLVRDLTPGLHIVVAVLAVIGLGGCAVLPRHPVVPVESLIVAVADRTVPYAEAVGGLPPADALDPTLPDHAVLPVEPVPIYLLPDDFAGLARFDMNGDGVVDSGEMTQAWLVRLVAITGGVMPAPAALGVAGEDTPLHGLRLSATDRRRVDAAYRRSEAGRRVLDETTSFMAHQRAYRRGLGRLPLLAWPM